MINIDDFGKLELRIGTIKKAESFPEAKTPAYKLRIDFGQFGKKWSSAQITENYLLFSSCIRILAATSCSAFCLLLPVPITSSSNKSTLHEMVNSG